MWEVVGSIIDRAITTTLQLGLGFSVDTVDLDETTAWKSLMYGVSSSMSLIYGASLLSAPNCKVRQRPVDNQGMGRGG